MTMRLTGMAMAIAMSIGLLGCAPKGAVPASIALAPAVYSSMARYERVYVLTPGDQIEIAVDRLPDLTRTVTIRPDGYVSLPKFGEIKVAGLSVPEADQMLDKLFAQRVIDPQVTVVVQNPREDVAFVTGEVGRATPVPLRQARTVAEALIVAGGVTHSGSASQIALIRLDDTAHLVATMVPRLSRGQAGDYLSAQAVELRGGDIIVVPETNRSKFARFVQDFINTPLSGVNQLFTPYLNYRLIQKI